MSKPHLLKAGMIGVYLLVLLPVFLFLKFSYADVTTQTTTQLEVTVITPTPVPTPTPTATPSSGGGGGGGGYLPPELTGPANAEFKGFAYPGALIHILKDGDEAGQTTADSFGNFTFKLFNMSGGTYNFGFWATDRAGRRSVTFTFQFTLINGSTNKISAIVMPPTISLEKDSVKLGEEIEISGASTPRNTIRTVIQSIQKEILAAVSVNGDYTQRISTADLEKGLHTAKSKTEINRTDYASIFSQSLLFGVGVKTPQAACGNSPDINHDGKVNLVDFSIMAYWWNKQLAANSPVDLDCDSFLGGGMLNLVDFSILAYNWTG